MGTGGHPRKEVTLPGEEKAFTKQRWHQHMHLALHGGQGRKPPGVRHGVRGRKDVLDTSESC